MNVFEVVAKITLDADAYDKKLNEESGKLKNLGSKLGNAAKAVGKASAAAIGAGATAIGALAKQAVSAYGEYEQLKGGVETLFGAQGMSIEEYAASVGKSTSEIKYEYQSMLQAQEEVLKNADEAYKTAGLSANEYMQTVTSFAASLNQSLGGDTQRAAKMADMAIKDMSDNANKMGTAMDSIQNAYQGFAKQNYTMLDNLKLGYGGTKSEMERLVEDAEKLNSSFKAQRDENGKLALSYADVVEAIHIVQDNMGVTGTTAKEAASTIQGSFATMKSSWQNLIAGLGKDGADLNGLIDNFVESLETLGDNVFPIVEKTLEGIGKLVSDLMPKLGQKLPGLLEKILPGLLDGVTKLVQTIADNLPQIIKIVLPSLIDAMAQVAVELAKNIPEIFSAVVEAAGEALGSIGDAIQEKLPGLVKVFETLEPAILGVVAAFAAYKASMLIATVISTVKNVITALTAATEGQTLAQTILNAVMNANPFVLVATAIGVLVAAFVALWNNCEGFREFWKKAWENIKKVTKVVIDAIVGFFKTAWEVIKGVWSVLVSFFSGLWEGVKAVFSAVVDFFKSIFGGAIDAVKSVFGGIISFFQGLWDGITGIFTGADDWFGSIFGGAVDLITGAFGGIVSFFGGIWDGIKAVFGGVADFFSSTFGAAASAVKAAFKDVTDTVDATAAGISVVAGAPIYRKGSGGGMPSNIPRHADGGVFYRPTLGIFGEAGAEAVVPLDQNKKWIHAVATDFATQMSGMAVASGASGDIIIPVYIGQNRIDEIVVSAQQRLNYRSGGRA